MTDKEDGSKTTLKALMEIMASLLDALGVVMGEDGSKIMSLQAGQKMGEDLSLRTERAQNVEACVSLLNETLGEGWYMELWKKQDESELVKHEDSVLITKLRVTDCPVRQVVLHTGMSQEGALCHLVDTYLASAISNIMEKEAEIKTTHPGSNSCLKELRVFE